MKSSQWLGTRHSTEEKPITDGMQAEEYLVAYFRLSGARYINGQLEKAPDTGRLHVQFYLNFKDPVRMSKLQKIDHTAHYEKVKIDNGASNYCMKEDTRVDGPWEMGTKPLKRNDKKDWEEIKQQAIDGKFHDVPADVYVRYFTNLQRIHAANLPTYNHEAGTRGTWVVGPPGTGKTHYARTHYGEDVYIKAQNKWWDGYKGQKIVVLDDLDTPALGHYLKIWADKWACNGEIKGATVALQHTDIVVTSNYPISELWKDDKVLVEALTRRFKIIEMNQKYVQPEQEEEELDLEGAYLA